MEGGLSFSSVTDELNALYMPSRDADAHIVQLLCGGEIVWRDSGKHGFTYPEPVWKYPSKMHVSGFGYEPVPFYTESVDAALYLVGDHRLHLSNPVMPDMSGKPWYACVGSGRGRGFNRATAICIAALRNLEKQPK